MKARITDFIMPLIYEQFIDNEVLSPKMQYFYFKIEGFCDAPEVFIVAADGGIQLGSASFIWDGPSVPIPLKNVTHSLSWALLNELDSEERKDLLVEEIQRAVTSKKREYWTCQYCEKKMHRGEFYDKKTCLKCAEDVLRKYKIY